MSVLKKDRKPTVSDALHDVIKIRQQITEICLRDFLYKKRTMPSIPKNFKQMSPNEQNGWKTAQQAQIQQQEKFDNYFINSERDAIISMIRELVKTLSVAEYDTSALEKVKHKSQGLCSAIKHELQYVYETIPANNNPALAVTLSIEQMIEDLNRLQFN